MDKNMLNFMKNQNLSDGLMLIDLPTGSGKTYMAAQNILKFIVNDSSNKKIFFVTTLLKNLPVEELEKAYSDAGKKEQFKKDVFVIKSNIDYLIENFDKVKNSGIKKLKKFNEIKNILSEIKEIEEFEDNPHIVLKALNNRKNELRKILEPELRREIRELLKDFPTVEERIEVIRNNSKYKWIGELYPTVFTNDYRVYLMSAKKFIGKNAIVVDTSYDFITSEITDDAIVFIDEFDDTKADIQQSIIEMALSSKKDYLNIFKTIHSSFITHNFSALISEFRHENIDYTHKVKKELDKLREMAFEIYNKFYLTYNYKVKNVYVDKAQNFLFNDGLFHTFLHNNCKYIRVVSDSDNGVNSIFFENYSEYNKNKSQDDIYLYSLIRSIDNFFTKFSSFIYYFSDYYVEVENERRRKNGKSNKFTKENATNTLYKEFGFGSDQKDITMKFFSTIPKYKDNEFRKFIPDSSFYSNGYNIFEFLDGPDSNTLTVFNHFQVSLTPEKIILFLAKKAKVIGLSATSTLESVLSNYNLEYFRERLGDRFVKVEKEAYKKIIDEYKELKKGYRKNNINVICEKVDSYTSDKTLEERLEEFIENEEYVRALAYTIRSSSNDKLSSYYENIYCNILFVLDKFIKTESVKSFLCLNKFLPSYTNSKLNLKVFEDFLKIKKVENECSIEVMKSVNYEKKKTDLLNKLERGEKVFVFSSYSTLGAGQNLQYKVPENTKVFPLKKYNKKSNDKRSIMKDFDGIYIGDITYIITNTNDKDEFGKEGLLNYIFEMENLYHNNEINIEQLRDNLRIAIRKSEKNIFEPRNTSVNNTLSYRRSVTRTIIQALGRICRTWNKNKDILIYTTQNLVNKVDIKILKDMILPYETKLFFDELNTIETPTNEYIEIKNNAERKSEIARIYINKLLGKEWNDYSIKLWKILRECVLTYPTIDLDNDSEIDEKYREIIEDYYIENYKKKSKYYYAQGLDYSLIKIEINGNLEEFKRKNSGEGYDVYTVSQETSRLDSILKYPQLREHFIDNSYATDFGKGKYILSPILFNNIYKGALGEVAGKFIIERELKIKLNDIERDEDFEVFDYKYKDDIYFDFKHWKSTNKIEIDYARKKISEKLDKINGKKVFIINIIADSSYIKNENIDGRIIEIPSLIDENGVINKENLEYIRRKLSDFDE